VYDLMHHSFGLKLLQKFLDY